MENRIVASRADSVTGTSAGTGSANGGGTIGRGKAARPTPTASAAPRYGQPARVEMAARGEVGLDDPVRWHLPAQASLPSPGGYEITLGDLATHRSGLPVGPRDPDPAMSVADLLAMVAAAELVRPGRRYELSYLGYALLGQALARAAGTDFETLLRQRVLEPLGMAGTGYAPGYADGSLVAGHVRGREVAATVVPGPLRPATGLRSSGEDMIRFLAANVGPPETDLEGAMRAAHEIRVERGRHRGDPAQGHGAVTLSPVRWWWPALLSLACHPGPEPPTLELPARPADAPGGEEIYHAINHLDLPTREDLLFREVARGNLPSWLREFRPVEVRQEVDGQVRTLTLWVTPDYLAVGSNEDHFYVPVSGATALRITELTGTALPTPGVVDAAWAAARVRLIPIRIPPDEYMATVRVFRRHDRLVQAQRRQHSARAGDFLAGHKLDLVRLTTASSDAPELGVYGWHHRDGTPIQPPHPVSPGTPPHFSIGIRLVHRSILIDGVEADLTDIP
jgi:hypothetical protein